MTLVPGDFLWCRRLVQYILTRHEETNLTIKPVASVHSTVEMSTIVNTHEVILAQ